MKTYNDLLEDINQLAPMWVLVVLAAGFLVGLVYCAMGLRGGW